MSMDTAVIAQAEEITKGRSVLFGFWLYLMTDLVLFASLFAVFAVMRAENVAVMGASIPMDAPYVLTETLLLLCSSFVCGFALMAANAGRKSAVVSGIILSMLLGGGFLYMEISEFAKLVLAGSGPQTSGYLSSYFTLVGTHGLHIFIGLLWALSLVIALFVKGLTENNLRKLALWTFFWHFLDIVWIFIFTVVYLQNLV